MPTWTVRLIGQAVPNNPVCRGLIWSKLVQTVLQMSQHAALIKKNIPVKRQNSQNVVGCALVISEIEMFFLKICTD